VQSSSLQRLVDTAKALPGERISVPKVRLAVRAQRAGEVVDPRALRQRLGRLLEALSRRLEATLKPALEQAAVAWDSFDEIVVLDADLTQEAITIATLAMALEHAADAEQRAIGTEVSTALAAILGIVSLIERRLATLVRLRVQSKTPELLPDGRPFLDVAPAFAEAALGWR
jgi:hypothetical protein